LFVGSSGVVLNNYGLGLIILNKCLDFTGDHLKEQAKQEIKMYYFNPVGRWRYLPISTRVFCQTNIAFVKRKKTDFSTGV